jgi:hypothetical protein
MSHISSRTTALAAAVFTLFAAAPALAKTPTHHQHARVLMQAGYAAPVTRVLMYAPPHTTIFTDDACDLPSSGCTNDQRISN